MGDASERNPKRRKIETSSSGTGQEFAVKSSADLENQLRFHKDSVGQFRQGIRIFRSFLTQISTTENTASLATQLKILKEYCDSHRSPERYSPSLPNLFAAWSFAAETRNDSLLSAIPSALAQLLKVISRYLEFREFGLSLCQSLLWRDQVRLIERGLNAPTSKAHVISPCLRLLTEVVGFDAGACASEVFFRREAVFKRLDVLLSEISSDEHNGGSDNSRPTLRRIAQRFVLANLKLQDAQLKTELILQGRIFQCFLRGMEQDSSDIVHDILQSIETYILSDKSISRSLKGRFLNAGNLNSFLKLYTYEHEADDETGGTSIRDKVHQLLSAACTQTDRGLLNLQAGWYPAGLDPDTVPRNGVHQSIDLGLDSPDHFDDYRESVPVRNGTLSTFIKTLMPEADTLQSQLLLRIFGAAPELVADYFTRKTKFKSPLKDDPLWRGEFGFLFSVIQLPVPAHCGWQESFAAVPPPISIIIESILPKPFTHSMLTKCINLNQDMFTVSASRAITVSVQKLQETLSMFRKVPTNQSLWSQAACKLRNAFLQRCPSIKDIASATARVPKDNKQLRGILLQCLSTFISSFPETASAARIDVSKYLTEALQQLPGCNQTDQNDSSVAQQLPDLLTIAKCLPEVKWFQQATSQDSTTLSTCALLIRALASDGLKGPVLVSCTESLQKLLVGKGILHSFQSFQALATSLVGSGKWTPDPTVFSFLDQCMGRIVQKPVRYLDMLEAAQQVNSDKNPLSLLACCVSEQWPFVASSADKHILKNVAQWIARFHSALEQVEENLRVMLQLKEDMVWASTPEAKSILEKVFEKQHKKPVEVSSIHPGADEPLQQIHSTRPSDPTPPLDLATVFGPVNAPATSLSNLSHWTATDLDTMIPTGRLSRLLHTLSSSESEIRISSFTTVQSLTSLLLTTSTHPAAQQLHLLLGEVLETAKSHGFSDPLPSVVPELAALLARVLHDPADRMYGKANRFLLKAPRWDLDRVLTYWMSKILLTEPETDDGHHLEVDRLLQTLMNGLNSPQDLEVYRRAGVWERVCALALSRVCSSQARRRVLGIVWRTMEVVGGKEMLVRRAGIVGWLAVMKTRTEGEDHRIVEALLEELKGVEEIEEIKVWRQRMPLFKERRKQPVIEGQGDKVDTRAGQTGVG